MGDTTIPASGDTTSETSPALSEGVTPPPDASTPRKRHLHTRRRFWLLLLLGAIGLYWLLMRSPLTRWVVARQIEQQTGLEVRGGSVILNPSGAFSLKSMTLAVRGIDGPGGEVIGWDDLSGTVDLKRLVGIKKTGPLVRTIEVLRPFVRFSQSTRDGTFGITLVKPPAVSDQGPAMELPRLRIVDGRIELAENDPDHGKYTPLRSIPFQGWMNPAPGEKPGTQLLALWESESVMGPFLPSRGLDLRGQIGPDGFSLAFGGVAVKDWPASTIPSRFREIYESLGLDGVVRDVTIDFTAATRAVRASLLLDNVAVNLPVGEDGQAAKPGGRPLRMSGTSGAIRFDNAVASSPGTISAELSGLIEDFPFKAHLNYQGTTLDAPFSLVLESEGFQLREHPELLRFAAPTVKQRLGQFHNPTGIVNTKLEVERRGGQGQDVKVTGEMAFHDAVAAFDRFPYEFRGLTGRVKFTENSLELIDIRGGSPGGATISAAGTISPLTDAAKVDLHIEVNNAPIDETLARAMGRSRRVLDELFSVDQRDRLIRAGLVSSGPAGQVPAFDLGGRFDVVLDIHRPEGLVVDWDQTIDVNMHDVNVLPERFPLPLVTSGINIWMDTNTIILRGGRWKGLSGGEFSVTTTMPYGAISSADTQFVPDVRVTGKAIPFDAYLAHAAAAAAGRSGNKTGDGVPVDQWLERALLALRMSGQCDAAVHISDRGSGYAGVDAGVSFAAATAEPRGPGDAPAPFPLSDLAGTITLSDDWLTLELAGTHQGKPLSSHASIAIGGKERGWSASVSADSLDLTDPIESLVDAFSPKSASSLRDARARLQPVGSMLLGARLSGDEQSTDALVELHPLREASLTAFGGRLGIGPSTGAIRLLAANQEPTIVEFDRFAAPLSFEGRDIGHAEISGSFRASDDGLAPVSDSHVALSSTPVECGPVAWFVRERLGADAAKAYNAVSPRGIFDLDTTFGPRDDTGIWAEGWLRPTQLSITVADHSAQLTDLSGELRFLRDGRGSIRRLQGRSAQDGEQWTFDIDGGWSTGADSEFSLGADLTLDSEGIPPSLFTFIPPAVASAMETMEVHVDGPTRLSNARLRVRRTPKASALAVMFDGVVDFADARFTAGRPISECQGQLSISAQTLPDLPTSFELKATLPRLRASNIHMSDAAVTVLSAPDGRIVIPSITADCYGGRVFGDATITPSATGTEFTSNTWLSGVRFAPTLRDLASLTTQADKPAPTAAATTEPSSDASRDQSRGTLDGWFGIAGILGQPESRRGRGEVVIGGGSVLQLPLVLPLISFSNFQLPGDEQLDHATASFYFQGSSIVFESMTASSESLELYGYGTATTPDLNLDMRFNSRSLKRVPMVTTLIEGFRDQLIGTSVTGPLAKPNVETVALPRAGSIFAQIFGLSDKEQETRLSDIELRLKRDIDRTRTAPDRSR